MGKGLHRSVLMKQLMRGCCPKVAEIVRLNTIWMFSLLGADKIASHVWINMFAMMNTHFRNIFHTVFLSTVHRMLYKTVIKPQWSLLQSHPSLPPHLTLVLLCQGGNLVNLTWFILCKSQLAVSFHLVLPLCPQIVQKLLPEATQG